MEEKRVVKWHHLDLARKRLELEKLFDSVINKIPDLIMPPAYRWEKEDDFFNQVKNIRIVPFRKQRNFEKCLSPETTLEMKSRSSGTNILGAKVDDSKVKDELLQSSSKKLKVSFRDFGGNESVKKRKEVVVNKNEFDNQGINLKKRRDFIKQRYSRLKIKKAVNAEEENYRIGYDKLFRKKPKDDYPFANPITECMLTDSNIDSLREIIVSSVNIEWKMLTPVRPHGDYEEKYFDKLIYLHRCRYKSRLESDYFDHNQKVPFKHTRHSFIVQCGSKKKNLSANKMDSKRSGKARSSSRAKLHFKPTIPTLTLTSDGKSSEIIGNSTVDDDDDDDELSDDEFVDFNYEKFSRFSIQNRKISEMSNMSSFYTKQQELDLLHNDDVLEDQVEQIINHLMSCNMSENT